jgi:hypothetical protein
MEGIVFSDRRRSYFQSCCFAGLTQSQLNQLSLAAVAGVWLGSALHLNHSSVERPPRLHLSHPTVVLLSFFLLPTRIAKVARIILGSEYND